MDWMMETKNISRVFGAGAIEVHALRDINVSIHKGALTILRGRSGSGKTTLMNIMGTLDRPTAGKVFFMGKDITAMSEVQRDLLRRREMGFVFQSAALLSALSAYENVELSLRLNNFKGSRTKRVEEVFTFVGLKNRIHHRPEELSGGEQQRVAIARAIVHRPKLIFADEPTADLDTHMGLQVMSLFRDLVKREGATILMTTHDPNMMELADHVYTLEDGAVVEELHHAEQAKEVANG